MPKPMVFFDESGNSGGNLLDKEQPIFVLASVRLTEIESASILESRDGEYKFTALKRSAKGRKAVLSILDSTLMTEECYLISALHKPFMAITKMVDLLIEPLAYQDGINLYEQGANLALSHLLYYCFPSFLGKDAFNGLCECFVEMVRTAKVEALERFYKMLDRLYEEHHDEDYSSELAVLLATRVIAEREISGWSGNDLDPAIPAFVEHASVWTSRLAGPFRIIHDSAKPITNEQRLLEAMMSTTDKQIDIGYDRRKMTFPIASQEIELVDSKSCLQLQVADILAGSAAYLLKAVHREAVDEFCKQLLETRVFSGSFRPVWPEPKFTPEELGTTEIGGIDSAEYIGQYIKQRLGVIPPRDQRRK